MSQNTALLKAELKLLSDAFPKSHAVFRVISANIDEVCCHFIAPNGKHEIICTISVSFVLI